MSSHHPSLSTPDSVHILIGAHRFTIDRPAIIAAGAYFRADHLWASADRVALALPAIRLPPSVAFAEIDTVQLFAQYLELTQGRRPNPSWPVADLLALAVLADYLLCPAAVQLCDDALLERGLPASEGGIEWLQFCDLYQLTRTGEGIRWQMEQKNSARIWIRHLIRYIGLGLSSNVWPSPISVGF